MISFSTFGESHGKAVGVVIEGIPAGLKVKSEEIDLELSRRQKGYGRGERMAIEYDRSQIISGVRWGETIGAPLCLLIKNNDWKNNVSTLSSEEKYKAQKLFITSPRPGHADLSGILKYDRDDITDVLERSSARETAARVAAGALFKNLLYEFGIKIYSWVDEIGGIVAPLIAKEPVKIFALAEKSPLRVFDRKTEEWMIKKITHARKSGDTLGGAFTVVAVDVPVGLGSYSNWESRLGGKIAGAMMSIQAIKGIEIGLGFKASSLHGSDVHDEIFYNSKKGYYRKTNNAGGIEGGISNGEDIVVRCAMKPIPTLMSPLKTVDIKTKKQVAAAAIRSDVCAVPSASVVGESMLAYVIAAAAKEKFGGDSMNEMRANFKNYKKYLEGR